MPNCCIVCGISKAKDPAVSLYRFPKQPDLRAKWLASLHLTNEEVKSESRVCSRHFRDSNPKTIPSLHIGSKFAQPPLMETARGKRRATRELKLNDKSKRVCIRTNTNNSSVSDVQNSVLLCHASVPTTSASHSDSLSSPASSIGQSLPRSSTPSLAPLPDPLIVSPAKAKHAGCSESHISLMYVSSDCGSSSFLTSLQSELQNESDTGNMQVTALTSQIGQLKVEIMRLNNQLELAKQAPFRIECIRHDKKLTSLYTGFPSHDVLMAFFKFLGPSVDRLQVWGTKTKTQAKCRSKLDPLNQLFMTLVKLKLDLNIQDIAMRFQISTSTVSRYFITWICFLYHELCEIEWFPSKDQIAGTLPFAFREQYPTTIAIIDASEIFVETPSDLVLQSTAWSNYKHHNTFKFLVSCTPNGAISYISPLYLGSVSDPELTRDCGFLKKLEGMRGASIMADRGFTIKESLKELGVELNLPPFMEGRCQLPVDEIQRGRSIASLCIHVERAIGRMKLHKILTGVFPLKMARLANQIVVVCAYLSNFHPALVPPYSIDTHDKDVDDLNLDDQSESDMSEVGI